MRIIVFDVAAHTSGALSILEEYYKKAVEDKSNKWLFVVSTPKFESTDNVTIVNYPWVKKSWIHRIYFELFVVKRIIKEFKADKLLSLQNIAVLDKNIKQTVYLHQPLPFVNYKFKFFEAPRLWFYQNIYCILISKSMKIADEVIVQTTWMKKAVAEKCKVNIEKIKVVSPKIDIDKDTGIVSNDICEENKSFFYPATPLIYKNHKTILEAMKILKDEGIDNYKVLFTFKGDENKLAKKLFSFAKKYQLPVDFIGYVSREEAFSLYKKSILLFPSYIETFGLPLLEAREIGSCVLASNTEFATEILEGYGKSEFFDAFDSMRLAELMKNCLR